MNRFLASSALIVLFALALGGCYAGPGHTRAAGAAAGTGAGALLGAAVGAHYGDPVAGAVVGGVMGYAAGATAAEGIAQDQEMYNSPRHIGGDRAAAGCPPPCPPRPVVVYDKPYGYPCHPAPYGYRPYGYRPHGYAPYGYRPYGYVYYGP